MEGDARHMDDDLFCEGLKGTKSNDSNGITLLGVKFCFKICIGVGISIFKLSEDLYSGGGIENIEPYRIYVCSLSLKGWGLQILLGDVDVDTIE